MKPGTRKCLSGQYPFIANHVREEETAAYFWDRSERRGIEIPEALVPLCSLWLRVRENEDHTKAQRSQPGRAATQPETMWPLLFVFLAFFAVRVPLHANRKERKEHIDAEARVPLFRRFHFKFLVVYTALPL